MTVGWRMPCDNIVTIGSGHRWLALTSQADTHGSHTLPEVTSVRKSGSIA